MKSNSPQNAPDMYARAFLEEVIQTIPPGQRLPGLRELMDRSRLGRIRLKRVLDEMVSARRLELRDRSGFYRLEETAEEQIVFIHFSDSPLLETRNSFPGGIVCALRQEIEKQNLQLQIINGAMLKKEELLLLLKHRKIHSLFLQGCQDAKLSKMISQQVPKSVSLLPHHTAKIGNELRDSPDMTKIQLKYLFQRNYRKIGYIHNVDDDWSLCPVQLQRLLDYYRIMAENGAGIRPEWVFYCGYTWDHFNYMMHKMMRSGSIPEAVIVPGSALQYMYRFCANNGITIGRELAIMGCDDISPDLTPRVTTVTNTPYEIGLQAWQLMQRCNPDSNICEYTILQIVTGETVLRHQQ